jgi:electron transfer flavoprotein alpha subunit
MAEYKGVLVHCETAEGKLAPIATELLGCGRKLANDLNQALCAVLMGSGIGELAQQAISYGADKVYVVEDPLLKDYQTDSYMLAMEKVAAAVMPQIIVMGQTSIGRDLAPRLAFKLNTAATLDCLELAIDSGSGRLHQTKPVYGGNARAVYVCNTDPQIVTVRSKAMTPLTPDTSRKGEIVKVEAGLDASAIRTKVLQKVSEQMEGVKLEDAQAVVAGGRGIGSADGFKQLAELAKLLKGALGASRPPCDNGWVPDTLQVGLTGKIVAPDLYVAVALSGSSQHLSGCSGAKTIVAINKDAEANIFKVAHFGIVGDWKQILPPLTAKIKELVTK